MLVGPVFAAGTVTSERERQTLELLLTTTVSPWHILWGKLLSSLRISVVLTSFLVWPLLLAWLLPPWTYWSDTLSMVCYLAIIAVSSLTTTVLAMFCSVIFRKTSVAMMTAYLVLMVLYAVPLAVGAFSRLVFSGKALTASVTQYTFTSPFAAAYSLPLSLGKMDEWSIEPNWPVFINFLAFYVALNCMLLSCMLWQFNIRWRVRT